MNTLEKINRAKTEIAKEILEDIYKLKEESLFSEEVEELYMRIHSHINKHYLFKSDYT